MADIDKKTEQEMLKYRNFGKKSLNEIGDIMEKMSLQFGMKLGKKKKTKT